MVLVSALRPSSDQGIAERVPFMCEMKMEVIFSREAGWPHSLMADVGDIWRETP